MEKDNFNIFHEAQLPISESELSKPTKDFVVNVITLFFNTFLIDAFAIKQASLDQLGVLLSEDRELYEEMIKLINMHAAMVAINEKIYVSNIIELLDLTSPTPKRTLRFARIVANFILYYKTKLPEINNRISQLEERQNRILQYNNKKEEAQEKIVTSKTYRETQTTHNESLKKEIESLRQQVKKKKIIMEEKKERVKILELEKKKNIAIYSDKKSEVIKNEKMTMELEAEVVESPEELNALLQKLEEQKESKLEERETKYEIIKEKNQLLERKNQILAFIQKKAEKFTQIIKIIADKKDIVNKLEEITKEKERIEDIISKLRKDQEMETNLCNNTVTEDLHDQIENRLLPLRSEHAQLCKQMKEWETRLTKEQERFREISSLIDKETEEVTTLENKISEFLEQCQEQYRKDMLEESKIPEIVILRRKSLQKKNEGIN